MAGGKDIDDAINSSSSYTDFIALMKAKGYEIKGEILTDSNLKYISFRPLDRERFIRGSIRTLGENYTKERINERIEEKAVQATKKKVSFSKKKLATDYSRYKKSKDPDAYFRHHETELILFDGAENMLKRKSPI